MLHDDNELYEFADFRLDVSERLLMRKGKRVSLSEKAFVVLCILVRQSGHLVGKNQLLAEVWADAVVEENNLDKSISLLRQVLGERKGGGKFIETVRGHGYRFVAEVRRVRAEEEKRRKQSVYLMIPLFLIKQSPLLLLFHSPLLKSRSRRAWSSRWLTGGM